MMFFCSGRRSAKDFVWTSVVVVITVVFSFSTFFFFFFLNPPDKNTPAPGKNAPVPKKHQAYWGGMWNPINPHSQYTNTLYQNIPNWIQWIAETGYDISKVKIGLNTNVYTSSGSLVPIINARGEWDPAGRLAWSLYLDLVTGKANSYFNNKWYEGKKLSGVFIWNASPGQPVPRQLLDYVNERLGSSLSNP